MVMLATPARQVQEQDAAFFNLFPHRFDYLYAPHPEPGTSPAWQTETRHPLTDRLLYQGSYLYGVRFGKQTQYCLLDIDKGSPYHPATDPFAIQRITAALEAIGLVRYLVCTSSDSGGLHLYFPFQSPQNTWELGAAITALLENAGMTVKSGLLEVFPNRKSYNLQGTSLFNGHRLPLQAGSYLLNQDFEPIWSDRNCFLQQWRQLQQQNEILPGTLKRILRQQRRKYQVSGKAAKFLNDLNTEIELGWNDHGQTNYLLGRIALRTYVFHHILENSPPLEGQALIDQIVTIARSLPGYEEWCRHQHELEHRASEWATCVENSRYFHYGYSKQQLCESPKSENQSVSEPPALSWNQQQSQAARERIKRAIANLLDQNALPAQASARFKVLTSAGIGGGSLYRHKDLWHPNFLLDISDQDSSCLEIPDLNSSDLNSSKPTYSLSSNIQPNFTNLFPPIGGKPAQNQSCSDPKLKLFQQTDRNTLFHQAFRVCEIDQILSEAELLQSPKLNQFDQLFQAVLIQANRLSDLESSESIEMLQLRLNDDRPFKPP